MINSLTVLSDADLDAIDKLLALSNIDGLNGPVYCGVIHPEVDLLSAELREAGFESYAFLTTFRSRRPFEKSMWVRRSDNRCVPELYALATLKYGQLPAVHGVQPYWEDKDWTNAVTSNVHVSLPKPKEAMKSQYGVRSGTPEYYKKYYENPANRAKQREASRKHAARRRKEVNEAVKALGEDAAQRGEENPVEELRRRILGPDGRVGDDDDRAFGREETEDVVEDPEVR